MTPAEPEHRLTDTDFGRLRPVYGFTDALSLSVSFSFSHAELHDLEFSWSRPSEVQRTAFHEAVHVNQMLATSYGYYCQLLRDFQAAAVIAMVNSIRTAYSTGPRIPIYRQVLGHAQESGSSEAANFLHAWYSAELMLRWFEGDADAFFNITEHLGPSFNGAMIGQYMLSNYWLTEFLRQGGRAHLPEVEQVISLDRTENEIVERERHLVALKLLLDFDAASVLESAARASEYWGRRGPVPAEMHGRPNGTRRRDMIRYQGLLGEATDVLPTEDTQTFVMTYATIADVVLNPPILPQHAAARSAQIELTDLDPVARMRTALMAARRLRPVSEMSAAEYARFSDELCAECGWPTPIELSQLTTASAPRNCRDRMDERYLLSLRLRTEAPHAFVDLSTYYRPARPIDEELRYHFSPPIILFSDSYTLHNDRDIVRSQIDSYMLRSYLRAILLTSEPSVTLPYPASDDEVVLWTRRLRAALGELGFVNPTVRLVPGRLRFPHVEK